MRAACNVGTLDRFARLIGAAVLLALVGLGWVDGWAAIAAVAVAAILGLTAVVRFCPLYALVGIRTCRAETR